MARAAFEVAKDIAADWTVVSPQAKTYLKGMHYLLGMDDFVADLDAPTTVRMFLLYSKGWTGPVAEKIKVELQTMRTTRNPKNADLIETNPFPIVEFAIDSCELCSAPLGTPGKYVEAHTHWQARARMCIRCRIFLVTGSDLGDGAVYIAKGNGLWHHLHGAPTLVPSHSPCLADQQAKPTKKVSERPKLRHIVKFVGA